MSALIERLDDWFSVERLMRYPLSYAEYQELRRLALIGQQCLDAEPWCYGVESLHSGEVIVRETFDSEEISQLHAQMNGGIVLPLIPKPV